MGVYNARRLQQSTRMVRPSAGWFGKVAWKDHPDTLTIVNNMASVYDNKATTAKHSNGTAERWLGGKSRLGRSTLTLFLLLHVGALLKPRQRLVSLCFLWQA
jgi:hypothetical protein